MSGGFYNITTADELQYYTEFRFFEVGTGRYIHNFSLSEIFREGHFFLLLHHPPAKKMRIRIFQESRILQNLDTDETQKLSLS